LSCCTAAGLELLAAPGHAANDELLLASKVVADGIRQTELSVPTIHCGGCMQKIERALGGLPGVEHARVNLSSKRVTIRWRADDAPPPLIETLRELGYPAHLFDIDADRKDAALSELVRALAVAGFAASNIMLLSVSIWSGAEPQTRELFHWLSALIALPTLAYSGRIFFRTAWQSLRHGRTNMDVPISVGVLLAFGMSLYETIHHGPHAYFDAAISLLFFLLIGRTLDHVMRERARVAVKGLARMAARGALVTQNDGTQVYLPVGDIQPGMTIALATGERVPVDARVTWGTSDLDCSLVSGESLPQPVTVGSVLQAGTLNLTGPLTVVATATAKDSFLADMTRMMEVAESGRSGYRRIADRAAALYSPVVHLTALLTFIGWAVATGDIHRAITIAIAVLIITCPCALGLAVPMVQVVAAGRLFEKGIMLKDGSALERLAEVDTVLLDKTGTLTTGVPRLADNPDIAPATLALAAAMAAHSRHPYSRALAAAGGRANSSSIRLDAVSEHPGFGLEARAGETIYRLGRPEWVLSNSDTSMWHAEAGVVLSANGQGLAQFQFSDRLRAETEETIAELAHDGFKIEIISGDRDQPVRALATQLGVAHIAQALPNTKVERLASLAASGRKVLMVGDGLNDAPALTAAHVSMAPASAVDIGRNAADLVFLRESLLAIPQAIFVARASARLIRQNFVLAIGYNLVAIPIAIAGGVTPLVAAIAMSGSSIVVVANALRLKAGVRSTPRTDEAAVPANSALLIREAAE
jgi:P-type Cu2+ transporter